MKVHESLETCKFCQKKHSEFYICYEHRLWRKVREALNKTPNRDVIFTVATMLGLRNANKPR